MSLKHQHFQFEGELYEQIDGVATGSPLGPLLANTYMCPLEENLQEEGEIPCFYKRYADDNFAIMPNTAEAYAFLEVLNSKHPALNFMTFQGHGSVRGKNGARFEINFIFNEGLCLNKWTSPIR